MILAPIVRSRPAFQLGWIQVFNNRFVFSSHQKLKDLGMKCGSFIWKLWFVLKQTFERLSARAECSTTPQRQGWCIYAAQLREEESTEWHNRVSRRWWIYGGGRSGFDTWPTKQPLLSHYGCGSTPTTALCRRRQWLTDLCLQTSSLCFMERQKPQQTTTATNSSRLQSHKERKMFSEVLFFSFLCKCFKPKLCRLWSWRRLRVSGGLGDLKVKCVIFGFFKRKQRDQVGTF